MLQYVLFGLALGSIYAIASSALVITFVSAGVLNFAFGSMAYVDARFYYWLNSQHHMATWTAGFIAIAVAAPLLGVFLYLVLFRYIRGRTQLIKIVTTIGLSVALPPVANLIFGNQTIDQAPGLASLSDKPFHIFGTAVTHDQVIIYAFLLLVVVLGLAVLRFTDIGLRVRAMVDSEAMTSLSGTSPNKVSLGVWAVSAMLAGLAGVLVAPTAGLTTTGMTTLMAAAFAAVVVARLTSVAGAVAAALAMGVVTDVIQKYLPANSSFTAAIIPSIPFAFILVALIYYTLRSGTIDENAGVGGPLDQAVRPASQATQDSGIGTPARAVWEKALSALPLLGVAVLPLIFHGSAYWLSLTALGMCYAITFLTFTVVTGEGGMLWLSQIIFAGVGALGAPQFANSWHLPILVAILVAATLSAVIGAVIGLITIRLGELYVALATLTFGLLVETLIFTRNRFLQGGLGVIVNRPKFAQGDLAFSYLAFAFFLIFALLIWNMRRSTSGLALRAVRDSTAASRTLGLSIVQVKVLVSALGAFVAAVGGGFLAMDQSVANPQVYATFLGLVWLAVVVTLGVRSISAAALAGLSFSLLPGVMQTYAPAKWGEVPAILFGLGAIGVAKNPEGAVLQQGRAIRSLIGKLIPHSATPVPAFAGQGSSTWPADKGTPESPATATATATPATADAEAPPPTARADSASTGSTSGTSNSMMRAEP
jgi:branched-chain amino acid transport system permease protein